MFPQGLPALGGALLGALSGVPTTVTLTPDGTLSNSGWTATGAASLHAALAVGDADYIGANTTAALAAVSLTDPAAPLTLTDATFLVRARLN